MMYAHRSAHVAGELLRARVCAFIVKLTVICGGAAVLPICGVRTGVPVAVRHSL